MSSKAFLGSKVGHLSSGTVKFFLLQRWVEDYQVPTMSFQQVTFSKPCSPIHLYVYRIHTGGHIFPVLLHCIVTLRFRMKSVISRLETIDQLPRLLQLSQLNWVPFTYWSNIKAKEFIRYHCWHLKFSTIFVLLHIWMKEIKEIYISWCQSPNICAPPWVAMMEHKEEGYQSTNPEWV